MHDIRGYLPELFNSPGSLLYIGARIDAHSWLEELLAAGHKVSILEVWEPNVIGLAQSDLHSRIKVIHQGDVRDIDNPEEGIDFDFFGTFDYIFYWHGPEHLLLSEIEPVLEKLWQVTTRTLALACPFGHYPQEAHAGNPYEEHKSTLYPNFFKYLGFDVATDGYADEPGGEIVAWKRK